MPNKESEVIIRVSLDEQGIPEKIFWRAPGSGVPEPKECKSFILSLWDKEEASAMRLDLWTKDLRIDEMDKFYFQTLYTMSENYLRATNNEKGAEDLKQFALAFAKKAGIISDEPKG